MSDIKINNVSNRGGDGGPVIAGISTVSSNAFMVMPIGNTAFRSAGSGRGVIAGGNTPSNTDTMTRIQISTAGNSVDFGNLTTARRGNGSSTNSSSTRGVFNSGFVSAYTTAIDYVTISSDGGANEFGFLKNAFGNRAGFSNGVRGLIAGGIDASDVWSNIIEYMTIATIV